MNQTNTVLNHLMQGKKLTRLEALFNYRVQNITARICDLRDAGVEVKADIKLDPNGGKYAEYSIPFHERTYVIDQGFVTRDTHGNFAVRG